MIPTRNRLLIAAAALTVSACAGAEARMDDLASRVDALEHDFSDDANVQKIVSFIRAGGKRRISQPRAGAENERP